MQKLQIVIPAITLFVLSSLWSYALLNRSGHTGFDLNELYYVFTPLMLIGVLMIKKSKKIGMTTAILSVLGIVSLIYFDKTNTLLQYNVWLNRGMP